MICVMRFCFIPNYEKIIMNDDECVQHFEVAYISPSWWLQLKCFLLHHVWDLGGFTMI